MVMMSSMKPSIDAQMAVISTAKGSIVARWLVDATSPPVGVRIGVASLYHPCPRIHLKVDHCLGLLPLN